MNALAELIALLAPPGCAACGRAVGRADERLCGECVRALPWLRSGCPRCALPKHRGRGCPAAGASFDRAWAPLAYEGVAQRLVAALKFRSALAAADLMAAHMAANLPRDLRATRASDREAVVDLPAVVRGAVGDLSTGVRGAGIALPPGVRGLGAGMTPRQLRAVAEMPADLRAAAAVLVPVPASPARRRARGFDPARVLAVALARRTGWPLCDCLVRGDRTGRQVGAGRRERRAPGRLLVRVRSAPPPLAILVDDVHTTGATLDASARALVAAGTTVIAAITYARTL